ncbi:major facilitator superfamily domain-containing protein [Pisolithus orientalis]|nr:major facilitator superfamily domain-containing protein [Pisolithus orientalis]KAI6030762.1 major facilitator superfamily domain-containing protein [Pisolithus orientalis]
MADIEKQSPSQVNKSSLDSSSSQCPLHPSSHSAECCSTPLSDASSPHNQQAWLTVAGSFLALFCSFGQMIAFGTFQSWYSGNQLSSMSSFNISWIGSLQLCVFFFMGGPVGRIFDAWGPSPLLILGTLISVLSLVFTSVASQYYQYLLAQGVLFGLSVALLFYPSVSSVATHFTNYRATAIGIASAGSGLGGVVYPIMLRFLFRKIGFAWGVRASALLSAVSGALAASTISARRAGKTRPFSLQDFQLINDRRFLLLVVGSFFVCLGIFIPYFYISDYTESLGISSDVAFYVLSIMNAGSILGRIAPAWLSDKIGRFNLLCPTAFFSGFICLLFWTFADNLAAVATFSTIYGFLSGAFVSVVTPCVAQISDMEEMGTRIGALYTFVSIPALTGGPIAGALLQSQKGSFVAAIAFAGSSMVLGSSFLLASKLSIDQRFFHRV